MQDRQRKKTEHSAPLVDWSDSYKIGIKVLDRQHQHFFALLNRFGKKFRSRSLALAALDELKEYLSLHFKTEEELMQAHDYPAFESHKREHDLFVEGVLKLDASFRSGDAVALENLKVLLSHWMTTHVLSCDVHLAPYLAKSVLR